MLYMLENSIYLPDDRILYCILVFSHNVLRSRVLELIWSCMKLMVTVVIIQTLYAGLQKR